MTALKSVAAALCLMFAPVAYAQVAVVQTPSPEAIDKVWAGHSVKFALLTTKDTIYAAYYDANRQLTLAQRPKTNKAHWVYHKLDTWVGWDSHNAIALGLDAEGRLHVAANMHVDPLTYFRTEAGGDVRTARRVDVMVDAAREKAMTYPIFFNDAEGRLIFKYRDGSSGRGNEIYNIHDAVTDRWRALTLAPLVDGEGKRNAYFMGPVPGPDGYFHIAWVWRDSPQAETNHDLSYAKSRDLINWQRADGTPLSLPIRLNTAEIVDPVPVKGGMINNNTVIGFDDQGRVLITYHKYDKAGNTQIWLARREGNTWRHAQISDWRNYRWDFKGTGSLNSEIFVEGARPDTGPDGKGKLIVPVIRLGQTIRFVVDAKDLRLIAEQPIQSLADRLKPVLQPAADAQVNVVESGGYALAWTARPPNRDQPTPDIPPPSTLILVESSKY